MSNKGRIITLVCEIKTDKYPEWIFDSHLKRNLSLGVWVKTIHDGDATEQESIYDKIAEKASDEYAYERKEP